MEFLLAWDSLGHVKLPSNLVTLLIQSDDVASSSQFRSSTQTCWSCANYGYAFGLCCACMQGPMAFMRSSRIYQARCYLLLKDLIEARLIASDARIDFICSIRFCLQHQIGIGQKWPRHGNQISAARFQRLFTYAWHVQPIGGYKWNGDRAHEALGHEGEPTTGHERCNRWDAGLVPADARVDDARTCLFWPVPVEPLVPTASVRHQVQHVVGT